MNRHRVLLRAAALVLVGALSGAIAAPARAQMLEETGRLEPLEDRYTFEGEAGQEVIVRMSSDEFDTVVALLGPDDSELAINDDAERSLNSRLVFVLPEDGTYTVVARAYSGFGDYEISVAPATALDSAYARAETLLYQGDYSGAIAAFTEAIAASDGNVPDLYWYRGDAYFTQENPEAAIADYRRAAELFREAGNLDSAASLESWIEDLESQEF